MKRLFYIVVSLCLLVGGCQKYDDTELRNDINDLKERVETLETLCQNINNDITALKALVKAVETRDYITNVTPITGADGVITGYTISFANSDPITIRHGMDGDNGQDGEDGQDGSDGRDGTTPVIGVSQGEDGVYYWTLNGEWLLDDDGNKIKASGDENSDGADGADGVDGKDGKDGVTPQLKIEDGMWYVSYDNGGSWHEVGPATGEQGPQGEQGETGPQGPQGAPGVGGDSMFTDVDYSSSADYVIFTLSNGTQIKIPTWSAFEALQLECEKMNRNIEALQEIVAALQNNDYIVSVTPIYEGINEIGYKILFGSGTIITIYHGNDGKDGVTPTIGVRQDSDGVYYWTLNGEWLLDDKGQKVKATVDDGKDGEDGVTPKLKIENGKWYVSYDNASSWQEVGPVTHPQGDTFFSSVTQDESYVYITLSDGTRITLLKEQSYEFIYIPDYNDGKATINYSILYSEGEPYYVPGRSTLRFKVKSTSETAAADLVNAYHTGNLSLSFEIEEVKVRSAHGPSIEIVDVKAEGGYFLIDILPKDFSQDFYKNRISYNAALVLLHGNIQNNIVSDFINFIPAEDYDILNLAVRYTKDGEDRVFLNGDVNLQTMTPYVNEHFISSADTDVVVKTTPNHPCILVEGDPKYYLPDELYYAYGYRVNIENVVYVASYDSNGKIDQPGTFNDLCWEDGVNLWNKSKFNVLNNIAGYEREVSLTMYDEGEKVKYDQRVGSYLEVVDSYFLGSQQVAVADKVTITKNVVHINFEPVTYDWTLNRAIELRGSDGTPYGERIVLDDVQYDNIYDIAPLLDDINIQNAKVTLNGIPHSNIFSLSDITSPSAGHRGTADITIGTGYAFASNTANTYTIEWQVCLSETTDAVITLNVTFGKYPETVVVMSEVDMDLETNGVQFKGADALIEDAYAALGDEKAGFDSKVKAIDKLYEVLTDGANRIINDPNTFSNINFGVNDNIDQSYVCLYNAQINDPYNLKREYTFRRIIDTWFGVSFEFIVTGYPNLPKTWIACTAEPTYEVGTYLVSMKPCIVNGVCTMSQIDLVEYFNIIGETNANLKVSFEFLGYANSTISNPIVNAMPLEEPIYDPGVGNITSYLYRDKAILTWHDMDSQIKVLATLWAGSYPIDISTLTMYVEDVLSFTASDVIVESNINGDTEVKIWQDFNLTSTLDEHSMIHNLIDISKDSLDEVLKSDYLTAYGVDIDIQLLSCYENANGYYQYCDSSLYTWDTQSGIFTYKTEGILNPIVAEFRVNVMYKMGTLYDGSVVVELWP